VNQWYLENRGPGFPTEGYPQPLWGDVIRLKICPDCDGRGYFVINPLHPGSCEAAHGVGNMTQCLTCLQSKSHFDRYGELPPELVARLPDAARAALSPTKG
jgi:hypothetical protein